MADNLSPVFLSIIFIRQAWTKQKIGEAASGRINSNDWPVFIGENSEETNREWNALIDDVRIYVRTLTADEIKAIYAE